MDDEIYTVGVRPEVADKIDGYVQFLAKVSEPAAGRLMEGLYADIEALSHHPDMNAYFERPYIPQKKYRWILSQKRYRIIYLIEDRMVYVDDVQDCRQDDNVHNLLT
jgi:hypothetical protein